MNEMTFCAVDWKHAIGLRAIDLTAGGRKGRTDGHHNVHVLLPLAYFEYGLALGVVVLPHAQRGEEGEE